MSWVTNYAHNRNCKIARVLYPTAREESSPCFSQGYSRHTTSQLTVLFHVFKFSAASFNFVTSSMVTVLNLDAILALIEIQEM